MSTLRAGVFAALLSVAVLLQLTLFGLVQLLGAGPDLVVSLVFCAAVAAGPRSGALAGFGAGALLDVSPPASHALGQWAFVLCLLGALTGLLLHGERQLLRLVAGACLTALAAPLLFTAVGLALGDSRARTDPLFGAVPQIVVWTAVAALLLLPLTRRLLRVPEPVLGLLG